MTRQPPGRRDEYRVFTPMTLRWLDNDAFGHVNNGVYFSFFDTTIAGFYIERKVLDLPAGKVLCLAVETGCRYHRSVAFPDRIEVGLRVRSIGQSSVVFELGVFRNDEAEAAAEGHFVHVFVDTATQRPVPIGEHARRIFHSIAADPISA